MRYVYLLKCSDNSLYTGITTDVDRRIIEHNESPLGAKYTKGRRPVTLVWTKEVENKSEAAKEEYRVRKLTKKKKAELIDSYNI